MRGLRAATLWICLLAALVTAPAAVAQQPASNARPDAVKALTGTSVPAPPAPPKQPALSNDRVLAIAATDPRVRDWIADNPVTRTTPEFKADEGKHIVWYVRKKADGTEVTEAQVWVSDPDGRITEVRVGPQVAWMMARGVDGAFGRAVTRPAVWYTLVALFLIPLLSVRRLVSWRTLDLLALVSFTASLHWFNRGEIFTSVPLQYPPLLYLGVRMLVIAFRRVRRPASPVESTDDEGRPLRPFFPGWAPTWVLMTALIVVLALRFGLNAFDSNVIDVGYAGVIGADRISSGQTPYGTFPSDCGQCDTYGPVNYLTYVPFEMVAPYTGKWDNLPAAHGAAVTFDLLCIAGLAVLGWRLGGRRLAAALALAWAAYPFTAYALESNSNDALVAALLIWTLVVAANPIFRGIGACLAVLTKFSPAILIPLLWRSPFPRPRARDRGWRGSLRFVAGLAIAALVTGWVVLLDGSSGARAFWSRTVGYQFGRESPFSIWGQFPDLRPVQLGLTALIALGALALFRWPRHRDLVVVAALAAAVLIGTQLVLTHWFYLYIPWFAPFVLLAVVPAWPAMVRPSPQPGAVDPGGPHIGVDEAPEFQDPSPMADDGPEVLR